MDKNILKPQVGSIMQSVYGSIIWSVIWGTLVLLGNKFDPWKLRSTMTPTAAITFYLFLAIGVMASIYLIFKLIVAMISRRDVIEIVGRKFTKEIVILDNHKYVDCIFDTCRVRWNGGTYLFVNLRHKNTFFESQNSTVVNTVGLLKSFSFLEKSFSQGWSNLPEEHFTNQGVPYIEQKQEKAQIISKKKSKKRKHK